MIRFRQGRISAARRSIAARIRFDLQSRGHMAMIFE
jgi:hypothetical protein